MQIKRSLAATPPQHGSSSSFPSPDTGSQASLGVADIKPDIASAKLDREGKATATKRNKPTNARPASEQLDSASPSSSPATKKAKKSSWSPTVTDWTAIEGWTAEKREAFMVRVISAGATAFGMTKIQINNSISAGKRNNFREKAIRAVKGDE